MRAATHCTGQFYARRGRKGSLAEDHVSAKPVTDRSVISGPNLSPAALPLEMARTLSLDCSSVAGVAAEAAADHADGVHVEAHEDVRPPTPH